MLIQNLEGQQRVLWYFGKTGPILGWADGTIVCYTPCFSVVIA